MVKAKPIRYWWNYFTEDVKNQKSESEKRYDHSLEVKYKVLKGLSMISVFILLIAAGVVSKGATFFIVSQIGKDVSQSACPKKISSISNVPATVSPTETEKVGWIWALFFSFIAPEIFTFIWSFRQVFMKSWKRLSWHEFLVVLVLETLHVIGVALLFLIALPQMNSWKAMMATSATAIIPGILKIVYDLDLKSMKGKLFLSLNVISTIIQVSALFIWPLLDKEDSSTSWSLPVGLLLTSFGWWECYVKEDGLTSYFWNIKAKMTDGSARGPTYLVVSFIKMGGFLTCLSLVAPMTDILPNWNTLYNDFTRAFEVNEYIITFNNQGTVFQEDELVRWDKLWDSPALVLLVQVLCSWIIYSLSKFACCANIQRSCFALPISLAMPICILALGLMCNNKESDPCFYSSTFPKHLFFKCPNSWLTKDMILDLIPWIFFYLSHLWITNQIWIPKAPKLSDTEQLFSKKYYSGLLMDTSIMFNRRADDGKISPKFDAKAKKLQQMQSVDQIDGARGPRAHKHAFANTPVDSPNIKPEDKITRIMACATMWHETSEEIEVCLKSIFLIDEDYALRHLAKDTRGVTVDFYEWESHIFFDDCMAKSANDADKGKWVVNSFVVDLINTVDNYGKKWFAPRGLKISEPLKIWTPYGGRIVWKLPGGTKMVCHLKDKNKIRHKKRWSQIMYMYYFLGYQLLENKKLKNDQKHTRAYNTFLLALDGDVDFRPDAVTKVVDLIKNKPKIGAVCGRIHPTGSGYMTWYQNFEYAIGHWLQKATEHVLGCVLCSPGCFSLFRGAAVMDNNVMRTYTTVASMARHYVQYDQGEDRWLCTLLLKQGWRVEYSAASDSFTACPQTFKEFYNQRRRWMPSTMLNIIDLLSDWKAVVKQNDDISDFYMFYQAFNLVGSILGPGSIFLMLIGAFSIAFGITSTESMIFNLVLLGSFIFSCCTMKTDNQILFAQFLTLIYAIIMIAVYLGIIIQIKEDGPLSLSALGFFSTFGSFVLAAMLHPQEWRSLICCVVYVATIPSMYLLLTVYSLFNMNNVSWGTREVPKTEAEKEEEAKQAKEEAAKQPPKPKGILGQLQSFLGVKEGFKLPGIVSSRTEEISSKLNNLENSLDLIKKGMKIDEGKSTNPTTSEKESNSNTEKKSEKKSSDDKNSLSSGSKRKLTFKECAEKVKFENRYWMDGGHINEKRCSLLAKAKVGYLDEGEIKFWKSMMKEYLLPLDENKDEKKKAQEELKNLKNSVALGFVLLNAMWITAIFMLQSKTDILGWKWPLGAKLEGMQFQEEIDMQNQIILYYKYLRLEPVGVVFVATFILVIALQTFGMLFHRALTLEQIIATTSFLKRGFDERELMTTMKDLLAQDYDEELEKGDEEDGHHEKKIKGKGLLSERLMSVIEDAVTKSDSKDDEPLQELNHIVKQKRKLFPKKEKKSKKKNNDVIYDEVMIE